MGSRVLDNILGGALLLLALPRLSVISTLSTFLSHCCCFSFSLGFCVSFFLVFYDFVRAVVRGCKQEGGCGRGCMQEKVRPFEQQIAREGLEPRV